MEEKGKSTVLQGLSRKQIKVANKFVPPFIVIGDKEDSCPVIQKGSTKGKGPNPCSNKGKNPAKKYKIPTFPENTKKDEENCVVREKWQPDGLRLDISLKFVNLGQCQKCNKWVHLKYYCKVEHLEEDDEFISPLCYVEE